MTSSRPLCTDCDRRVASRNRRGRCPKCARTWLRLCIIWMELTGHMNPAQLAHEVEKMETSYGKARGGWLRYRRNMRAGIPQMEAGLTEAMGHPPGPEFMKKVRKGVRRLTA